MIQPTNLGEISAANSMQSRVATPESAAPAGPADQVSINQGVGGVKGNDRASSSRKRSRSHSSHSASASKTSKAKAPQMSPYDKASEKFFASLVKLQGCSPADQKFVEDSIVATHQLNNLDPVQKHFVMAQGVGNYAVAELGNMYKANPDRSGDPALQKREKALCDVVKTANSMVNTYIGMKTPVPTVADFNAGVPGGALLNPAPTPANAPTGPSGPTTPGGPTPPTPPANGDQAARDDYNQAMKIYQDIIAADQKNLADMMKIVQNTQTAIYASMSNLWAGWAKVFADGIAKYNRFLGYDGNPKNW